MKLESIFNSLNCYEVAKTKANLSHEQAAGTKKVFIVNFNIIQVFKDFIGYVKDEVPSDNYQA